MFLLMTAWGESIEYRVDVPCRVGLTFAKAGVGITITTLTDFLAFLIGCSSVFIAVRRFCLYTGKREREGGGVEERERERQRQRERERERERGCSSVFIAVRRFCLYTGKRERERGGGGEERERDRDTERETERERLWLCLHRCQAVLSLHW